MSDWIKQVLMIGTLWVFLGGCVDLAPRSDPSSFYILGALWELDPAPDRTTGGVNANFSVGLGPIVLPAYLDRPQIATRTSTNRLSYSETNRWAAPLAESFSRVLEQNVSYLLKPKQILQFPWRSNDAPDYQVKIEVLQFEGNSNQEAVLTALWTVIDRDKTILVSQNTQLKREAGSASTEDLVKAMSKTLGELSLQIAKTLLSLGNQGRTGS